MNPEPTREELLSSLKEANTHHQAALMQLLEAENKCLKLMLEIALLKRGNDGKKS